MDKFFKKYTHRDLSQIEPYTHKLRNLIASSWLETVFEGRPKGYNTPKYNVYKYEHSQGLTVLFQVEVRLVKQYVPPNCNYDSLEIERTAYLPLYGCTQWQIDDMRITFGDPQWQV